MSCSSRSRFLPPPSNHPGVTSFSLSFQRYSVQAQTDICMYSALSPLFIQMVVHCVHTPISCSFHLTRFSIWVVSVHKDLKLPSLSSVSVFFFKFLIKIFEINMNREASCIRVNSQSKFSLYLTPLSWFL